MKIRKNRWLLLFLTATLYSPLPLTSLEEESKAPQLVGIEEWINSPPLSLEALHGKVVLIDFWAYSCINCIRTLPHLENWYKSYKDKGFVIIGVHSPEFDFEKVKNNVQNAIIRFGITYPVAMDSKLKTWEAFHNRFWPAEYLIDQNGIIRKIHIGEGNYTEMENAIRTLLKLPQLQTTHSQIRPRELTPETYLGYGRAERYAQEITLLHDKSMNYTFSGDLKDNEVALQGPWRVEESCITSTGKGSSLELNFIASNVYLVLSQKGKEPVQVLLDGKAVPQKFYTKDMDRAGTIMVVDPRKYDIVHVPYGRHKVQLFLPEGVSAFAFTFGDEGDRAHKSTDF